MQIKPTLISYKTFVISLMLLILLRVGIEYVIHPWKGFYGFGSIKSPHLKKLELDIDQVKWFRIWYGAGHENNNYGDKYGYYAVSGRNAKLKKCDLYSDLNVILDSIKTIKFSATDYYDLGMNIDGDDEFVSIRLKFKNKPYSKMGEFELYYAFSADTLDHDSKTDYIILGHSDYTRYLIKKEDHPALVQLFERLTYREYGDCMELRMM
jgi:hypothetical protein